MRLADATALRIGGKDAIEARLNGQVVWSAQQAQSVIRPVGFSYTPPFSITRLAPQRYEHDFNWQDYLVDGAQTYYLSPEGSDANDGLTSETPKKSISTLIAAINAAPVTTDLVLAPGVYEAADSLSGVSIGFDANMLCPTGRAILRPQIATGWTKTPGRANIWQTTQPGSPAVIDMSWLDSFGIERRLRAIGGGDLALLDSTPGAATFSGDTVYVHAFDGREPDADIWAFATGQDGFVQTSGQRLTFQNVHFWGWRQPVHFVGVGTGTYVFRESSVRYSQGAFNGLETSGTIFLTMTTILDQCDMSYNRLDGAGYRSGHVAIELDSLGVWNGYVGDNGSDNGSTTHQNVTSLRVNCTYRYNDDRNLHDVNTTTNWLIGCKAGDAQNVSTDGYNNANFLSGIRALAEQTKSWFQGCTSLGGSASDLGAFGDAIVNTYECAGFDTALVEDNATITDADPGVWPALFPPRPEHAVNDILFNAEQEGGNWQIIPEIDGQQVLWQDEFRSTPALVDGDPVRVIDDISGNFNRLLAFNMSSPGILRFDGANWYIQFSGAQGYVSSAINWLADAGDILQTSVFALRPSGTTGYMAHAAGSQNNSAQIRYGLLMQSGSTSWLAGTVNTVSHTNNTDLITACATRRDTNAGVQSVSGAESAMTVGAGAVTAGQPLTIGFRSPSSAAAFFTGRWYGGAVSREYNPAALAALHSYYATLLT